MEVGLSDTQVMFRDATRRLLRERSAMGRVRELIDDPAGFDREVWTWGGELGWTAMLVPEKFGGGSVSGSPLVDATIVAEEMGRAAHPSPFHCSNVVAFALAEYGSDAQKEEYLPSIATGQTIATWAYAEPDGDWRSASIALEAASAGRGYVLNGVKTYVQDARSADLLLVTARSEEGLIQFVVPTDTAGVTVTPLESLDLTRRLDQVEFCDVAVADASSLGEGVSAADAVDRQLQVALVLQCADTNGATDAGLAMTVEYSKDRVAFGRPIGSYQALKHRMADHRMWLEGSFATTAYAARRVHDGDHDAAAAARVAKAHVGKWSTAILHDCVQIHGGIGMTWDYDLHLYFRRAISNEVLYGSPYEHCVDLVDIAEGKG